MKARKARLRANPALFQSWPPVPEAQQWLKTFEQEKDRYPFLLVLGPSRAGKTEWAKSLFNNALEVDIGTLPHFPDSMRTFRRGVHDGIVLDDVRDLLFLEQHQEKLQGWSFPNESQPGHSLMPSFRNPKIIKK